MLLTKLQILQQAIETQAVSVNPNIILQLVTIISLGLAYIEGKFSRRPQSWHDRIG